MRRGDRSPPRFFTTRFLARLTVERLGQGWGTDTYRTERFRGMAFQFRVHQVALGQVLSSEDLHLIRQVTRDCSRLSRTELSRTLCELLDWRRPNGALKTRECYDFLQRLQARGWLSGLPPSARPVLRNYLPLPRSSISSKLNRRAVLATNW